MSNLPRSVLRMAGKIEALLCEHSTAWQTVVLAEVMATVIAREPACARRYLIDKFVALIEANLRREEEV